VRIVAATNRDLLTEVQNGNFREDLYYRLNVVSFTIPPLRDRPEDIPLLVTRFMKDFNAENNTRINLVHPEAMDILYRYAWPGNIRELKNAVERALILAGGTGSLIPRFLPPSVLKGATKEPGMPVGREMSAEGTSMPEVSRRNSNDLRFPDLNERQRQVIEYLRINSYISNQQYVNMMRVSRRTCVRDFNDLMNRNLIVREGKKKSCTYRLADGV
jgi:DNA-binding NtrC family response regulator